MGVHTKVLVHWTGKDIEAAAEDNKPLRYVGRLRDDLEKGLFTRRSTEDSIRNMKVKDLVRICFTEIRLSQAQTHARRYGRLGIGFSREFVLDRGGRPVIYVPFRPKAGGSLLEDSIRSLYKTTKGTGEHRSAKWILAYVKRMSNGRAEDYYEEMEWRLVYDESPDSRYFAAAGDGEHRLKFTAHDVKVIVFPDEPTKQLALADEFIGEYFSEYTPVIATLEDCGNF